MSPEAQRIAIAEACGWKGPFHPDVQERIKDWPHSKGKGLWVIAPTGGMTTHTELPDYLTDLNAMHEAEKVLTGRRECPPTGQWSDYWQQLISVCYPALAPHATAAQRAEAFLRTIGKWEEKK